jgi:hypothetical protein
MLQRIEKGDPKCEIGAVFEVAIPTTTHNFRLSTMRSDHNGNVQLF